MKPKAPQTKRRKSLLFPEFVARYGAALREAESEMMDHRQSGIMAADLAGPTSLDSGAAGRVCGAPSEIWGELRRSKIISLLRETAESDHAEAYKLVLHLILIVLEAQPPKYVFTPWPKTGTPGRPVERRRKRAATMWSKIGEPSLYKNDLAQAVYGAKFTKANGAKKRKMRDKLRLRVQREIAGELEGLMKKNTALGLNREELRRQQKVSREPQGD